MSSDTAPYRIATYEAQKEKKRAHEANRRKKERDLLDKIREFILKIEPNHVSKLEKLDVLQTALVHIQQIKGNPAYSCIFANFDRAKAHIQEQNLFLKTSLNQARMMKNTQLIHSMTPVIGTPPSFSVFLTPPTPPVQSRLRPPTEADDTIDPVNNAESSLFETKEEEIDVVSTPKSVWRPWQ